MSVKEHPIYAEVKEAYIDAGAENVPDCYERRNLGFRASQAVSPTVAAAIMEECCPGYNAFEPSLLRFLPDDCTVTLAREGSVCIYVKKGQKKLPTAKKLKADEYDVMSKTTFGDPMHRPIGERDDRKTEYGGYEGEMRIWWD